MQHNFSGSDLLHEITFASHRYCQTFGRTLPAYSRRIHQPTISSMGRLWTTPHFQSGPIMESPSFGASDSGTQFQSVSPFAWRTESLETVCTPGTSTSSSRCVDAQPVSRSGRRRRFTSDQRTVVRALDLENDRWIHISRFNGCHRFTGILFRIQKKRTGKYSARRAALGARTLKTGQSPFFV